MNTQKEKIVFAAIKETKGYFYENNTTTEDVIDHLTGTLDAKEIRGVLSSLVKKNIIMIDVERVNMQNWHVIDILIDNEEQAAA